MTLQCAFVARGSSCLLAGLASLAGLVAGSGVPVAAESWPANVRALYEINFNGFTVGTFEFQSQAESQSYTLTGNAHLSVLLGAFSWAGSTRLGFSDGTVTNITNLPPMVTSAPIIPLREHHLKGVVDPLSAIMMLT